MEINGNYTFNADKEVLWSVLMDPDVIAAALPGVDRFVPLDNEENAWRAEAKLSIGPVTGSYAGFLRMTDIDAPNQYRLTVHGEGQNSIIDGSAMIVLNSLDGNSVILEWTANADISGKLSGVGQRLIKATANMMSRRFFSALAKNLSDK